MKHNMKKTAAILATTMVVSGLVIPSTAQATFNAKEPEGAAYHLYDVNKDGVKEMFLAYPSGVRMGVDVYGYRNDEVVRLKSFSGVNDVKKDARAKQVVLVQSDSASETTYTTYKISKGALKKVTTYEENGDTYTKDGVEIEKDTYEAYVKKVDKLGGILDSIKAYTAKNIKKMKGKLELKDFLGKSLDGVL